MKTVIVGFGHVGSALWEVERNTHEVSVVDINEKITWLRNMPS